MSQPSADTVVHLFSGPYITAGGRRCEVPASDSRLLVFVALHRCPVERRRVATSLSSSMASRATCVRRCGGYGALGIYAVISDQWCQGRGPRQAAMIAVSAEPLRESAQQALIEAHRAEGISDEGRRCFEA